MAEFGQSRGWLEAAMLGPASPKGMMSRTRWYLGDWWSDDLQLNTINNKMRKIHNKEDVFFTSKTDK